MTCTVYDSYQYVSVEASLRSLLCNPEYVRMMFFRDCYDPNVISDC